MTGHNPTDRSKLGTKRHILTDKKGIPISAIITSANIHDVTVAIDTVDSIIIKRPSSSKPKHKQKQNLCLDKAYHSKDVEQEIIKRGYILHIYDTEEKNKDFIENILLEDGLWKEQIHGIIDSGNYLHDMRRRKRITLVLCN
jgi:Transposase DDE domain